MGYAEENLVPGETVTYRTNLHPIIFAVPLFWASVGIAVMLMAPPAGVLILLPAAISGLSRLIAFKSSEFAITERRVLIKVGALRRHTLELMLAKVEGFAVDQGIMGRIFNFGTIVVRGTGGTHERFHNIENPLEFRRQVQARA
jgi:uncharacterized membrane protein YdbT with pleckstrin-like domain